MSQEVQHQSKVSRRLTETTAPEVCELIYAPRLRDFAASFGYLTEINEAHVLMLRKQGLISAEAARGLAAGLLEMDAEGPAAVPLDPEREDAYFNYEARLIDKVGIHVGGQLHTARSRNDILATIDHLRMRDFLADAIDAVDAVRRAALVQAERYAAVVMPGYTHLQPAQPMTYGFFLAAVAHALARDVERLEAAYAHADACPLGAGAFAGTTFAIDRAETASLLGFPASIPHTLDAVGTRDFLFEAFGALALLASTWSRIAQDYFVWCTDEFGLIDFPDSVAGTSSIMPQKKNPVVLEYLKGCAGRIIGAQTGALAALKGTNFSHTGDANRESIANFWSSGAECLGALKLLALVVGSAKPREAAMLKRARENFCSATDLADTIVRDAGVSFREAHHIVGAVVRAAMDAGLAADRITLDMVETAAEEQIGRRLGLTADAVHACLDPIRGVAQRQAGGPSPDSVKTLVAAAETVLARHERTNHDRRAAMRTARAARRGRTEALAG